MFILDSDEPTATPPLLVLTDELLDLFGERYLSLPPYIRKRITFQRYVIYRNGALLEKLRHHRHHRRGRSSSFHAIVKGSR